MHSLLLLCLMLLSTMGGDCADKLQDDSVVNYGPFSSMETPVGWAKKSVKPKEPGMPALTYSRTPAGYASYSSAALSLNGPVSKNDPANVTSLQSLFSKHTSLSIDTDLTKAELEQLKKVLYPEADRTITVARWMPLNGRTALYTESKVLCKNQQGPATTLYLARLWTTSAQGVYTFTFSVQNAEDEWNKYLPVFKRAVSTIVWKSN